MKLKDKILYLPRVFSKFDEVSSLKVICFFVLRKVGLRKIDFLQDYQTGIYINKIKQKIHIRPFTSDFSVMLDFFLVSDINNSGQYDITLLDAKANELCTVVDAGANIGLFSVLYASKNSAARIVAVEPDGKNLAICKKNTAFIQNYKVIQGGVWSHNCNLRIDNPKGDSYAFIVKETTEKTGLRGFSLSSIMKHCRLNKIDLLKMDIEGSENVIFKDETCEEWIESVKVAIIEIHDSFVKDVRNNVVGRFETHGFWHFESGENTVFINNKFIDENKKSMLIT